MSGVYTTYVNGKTGHIPPGELPAVPASFADLAAVKTYLDSLVAALIAADFYDAA